ncbi:MAG TPA: response regulator [Candidatus Limnocylindrales bacterium]|nr:response regulator [Candidatus Limnocylindrales bacterium]
MKRILVADDDRTTRLLISELLRAEKFTVATAADGADALKQLKKDKFDLTLLDIWMPKKNGIEVLAELRKAKKSPKVIVMTSDDAPQTLLAAIKEQAYQYVSKPIDPPALIQVVKESLQKKEKPLPIEVVSARPEWVELLVPCSLEAAERIEGFMAHLKGGLTEEVRSAIGQAFHELLANAVEWGGKLDTSRKVRISYLRAKRMLLYRIADPGPGFKLADLSHAAITHAPDEPTEHDEVRRQKGLRPGGFGLVLAQANVDELLYNEAQNEVVFVKYLDPQD